MPRAKKASKYSRRTSASIRRSRRAPIIIGISVFILITFALAIILGAVLKNKADGYEQESDSESKKEENRDTEISRTDTPEVNAYYYSLGADAYKGYLNDGISDFSVCLRKNNGNLTYHSKLCESLGWNVMESEYTIEKQTGYIHRVGGYFCGYFYVLSQNIEDENLRRVYSAYEISLIGEAMKDGLDDIMLVGIDVSADNIERVVEFVSEISDIANDCRVGVLMSPETVKKTENNEFYASRIFDVCDYIALDMTDTESEQTEEDLPTETEQTLDGMHYYVKSYGMRLVFDRHDTAAQKTAEEMGYSNIQRIEPFSEEIREEN